MSYSRIDERRMHKRRDTDKENISQHCRNSWGNITPQPRSPACVSLDPLYRAQYSRKDKEKDHWKNKEYSSRQVHRPISSILEASTPEEDGVSLKIFVVLGG